MGHIYSMEGIIPVVHPDAFVHPTAVLIGDVIVGAGCYVGPNASLRGDFGRCILEAGSNLQDTCVMHSFPGMDTLVEENGHIGHGAVLHGCRIGRNAMVGMNAVVMDGADVGEATIVAACAFVKANDKIPPRSLVMGVPAKVVRELTSEEMDWKAHGTTVYQQLAHRSRKGMQETEPLPEPEPQRRRIQIDTAFEPLFKLKTK
ncbi:MAG: transferase hexapeptide repeat family protein [Acidobacteriaceae bacterium]|nr:transferase hexapeptide repeat family protein [Acidobacteriaceae bacterium]